MEYVSDMLACCDRVIAYTDGVSRESFDERRMVFDATVRNLELLGEAANQLPDEVRAWAPEIERGAPAWRRPHPPGTWAITSFGLLMMNSGAPITGNRTRVRIGGRARTGPVVSRGGRPPQHFPSVVK